MFLSFLERKYCGTGGGFFFLKHSISVFQKRIYCMNTDQFETIQVENQYCLLCVFLFTESEARGT